MWQLTACLAVLALASSVQVPPSACSAFSVGHGGYIARDGKIWFRNILEDTDRLWNQERSHFECYDPGYYFISFHGLSRRGTPVTLHLYKNYHEVLAAYGDGGGYNTASNSGVLYLDNGDTISLHVVEGKVHESSSPSRNYITLSGFKISDGFVLPPRFPSNAIPVPVFVPAGARPDFASAVAHPQRYGSKHEPTVAAIPEQGGVDDFTPLNTEQGGPN